MKKWHQVPKGTKIGAYTTIAEATGMASYAVEKDWWVVRTLEIIFNMEIGQHLVFKGGTSLSKAWGLIERFSEDIDLAVDRNFLGFEGELSKRQITKLRKAASSYIAETFYPELRESFVANGLEGVEIKLIEAEDSDQDPRIIEVYYPYTIESPGYVQPRVQIEIGCRSLREPYTIRTFNSLVDEHYPDADFVQPSINIPTVNPERTFLEKIFLLHEEFQKKKKKMRVDRLSRYLYDISQLSGTNVFNKSIKDKELYETITNHRFHFTKVGGVDYKLHQPKSINPIPPESVIADWEKDYKTMQEQMIYGRSPSFKEIIDTIGKLKSEINSLGWEIDGPFNKSN